jgi:hypothetical protein
VQVREAGLLGTRSEELHTDARCCGLYTRGIVVYDAPSERVLQEIEKKTRETRENADIINYVRVVTDMYGKYVKSLTSAEQERFARAEQTKQMRDDAYRHLEDIEHRKKLELASASAQKMVIVQNSGSASSSAFNATRTMPDEDTFLLAQPAGLDLQSIAGPTVLVQNSAGFTPAFTAVRMPTDDVLQTQQTTETVFTL